MNLRPRSKNELSAPPRPQVNLLPPEIRAARALQPVKRWMMIAVAVALVVVVGAYFLGTLERSNARSALDSANEETTVLLAEQAKYAEVPLVTGALEKTKLARAVTMSTEVLWADYLGAIESVINEGVSIDTFAVNLVSPGTQAPLETPALAEVTLVTRSLTPPDVAEWMRLLESIPGFADARVTTVDVQGDSPSAAGSDDETDDGSEPEESRYYVATTTVLVTVDALSHRFDPAGEGAGDAE